MSSITELATKVRNLAGAYPAESEPSNPRFEARIETEQGTTMRVRCQGDQASILALAKRLEAGESKRKTMLRHPTPLRSHVNLNSRAFNEQTFRELITESWASAAQYAENMGRQVVYNEVDKPCILQKRPSCLADFPELELVHTASSSGSDYGGPTRFYAAILVAGGIRASEWCNSANEAIESFKKRQADLGDDNKIHKAIRHSYDPDFQANKRQALLGGEHDDE